MIPAMSNNEKWSSLMYLTNKSTSLRGVSSPREHEPKSQAFSIGWLARYSCIFGIISCTFLLSISLLLLISAANIQIDFHSSKNLRE